MFRRHAHKVDHGIDIIYEVGAEVSDLDTARCRPVKGVGKTAAQNKSLTGKHPAVGI